MIVFCSTKLTQEKLQSLLEEPSIDVWKVGADGGLDIRMSWELYERLGWEECSVLHESVEELVVNFEKQLHIQTDAEWFEAYVSLACAAESLNCCLKCFVFCSILMMRLLIGTRLLLPTIQTL